MEDKRQGVSGLVVASVLVLLLVCALVFGVILVFATQPTVDQQTAAIHARNSAFNMEQTTPNIDAHMLATTQEALLHAYGWVDQEANIARIPIERAMQLIATEPVTETSTSEP
jgi:hypothetical protein